MADNETNYLEIPFLYESRGLEARSEIDRCPPRVFIDLLNCLERDESSMSSRFGTIIQNRDAVGAGTANHFFSSPVTTIARLNYQSSAQRYAGLADGTLWTRQGNAQGPFTEIYSGLSGKTFGWLVNNTFASSQPWLYIYDANASIATALGSGTPRLNGIDPPPYTANTQPYAPLLVMIDSFASTNTYTTANVSAWANAGIETLLAASGQQVTDFTEFFGITISGGGGGTNYSPSSSTSTSASFTQTGAGSGTSTSTPLSGFASVPITAGQSVSLTIQGSGSASVFEGGGSIVFQYSPDSGNNWQPFAGFTVSSTTTFPPQQFSTTLPSGVTNLNTIQVRVLVTAGAGPSGNATVTGTITNCYVTITGGGLVSFGPVTDGMIALLNTNTIAHVPVVSVTASGLAVGLYKTLTVITQAAHGLSTGTLVGLYWTSNDLVDGFYAVTVVNATTFTVPYSTAVPLSATGGYVFGGAAAPNACVLTNEYSAPYPPQMSAYGFYEMVPTSTTSFPVSAWSGTVAANTTGTVGVATTLDLSQNNQITDDDLIVITLAVSNPANVSEIELQFSAGSNGGPNYYSKTISQAYYQGSIAGTVSAYQATENQILADTLGLTTGAPPGSTTAQLQPANFSTGAGSWVACLLRRGDFLPVGQAGQPGFDWSNIAGWQLSVTTNTTGTSSFSVNAIYLQGGYGPSSFGGIGYDWRYTYWDNNTFTESSPAPEQIYNLQYGYLSSESAPIYLRQAAQVTGFYSADPQVTHVRIYRRGGTLASNWFLIDQIPNITGTAQFFYKDVIADASLLQAPPLQLDNDPPVTSTLPNPVSTTLSAATVGPGNTFYSTYAQQMITVSNAATVFLPEQAVVVGNPSNLELVRVIAGGTGQFTAILRLQHNAGEPVSSYAIPRQPCTLCAIAYGRVWLAGDPNNPHYLYYSKQGQPEQFGPQNYIPVSSPDDPIVTVINWRGTLICGTLKSWWIIVGGASPRAQPTGAQHGIVASQGWVEIEGAIMYQAADGLRQFSGADGVYKSLPVEWLYRNNPVAIPPLVDLTQIGAGVMAYYQNVTYLSYVSQNNGGQRYRLNFDHNYQRFRYDDVAATAMLWEKDINTLLAGKEISPGNYAIVQDQVGDYDDGGWVGGNLVQTPINLAIQMPYNDLGKPHNPKQWNMLETDANTQNQTMATSLLFEDGAVVLPLANLNTGLSRQKVELPVNAGAGQQAYRASIRHTMAVTVAPTLYQEAIHARVLAGVDSTFDTYWLKPFGDLSGFIKEGYFDYTATATITVSLFADSSETPYFTFTLPIQNSRYVQRVRFGNVNPAAPAFNCRLWRAIGTCTGSFQWWQHPRIMTRALGAGNTYKPLELPW